jgi:DNA-binding response OmpR family regulator
MRVLLVDDEEELVSTLAERLGYRDIDARFATSGEDALVLARAETFDLAVLDMKMPGMGGVELKHELEILQPDMKFIFVTGHGSETDFKAGTAEAGREFYLIKPLRIDTLMDKMREALAERRQP